jgi:signal transduction histidine kinase
MGAAGLALVALEPGGPGEAAVFTAVAIVTFRFPARSAQAVVACTVGLLELELLLRGAAEIELLLTLGGMILLVFGVDSARRSRLDQERARVAELEAAVGEERTRLAREIHDVLAHSLTALVVQLDSAKLIAAKQPADLPAALDTARHLAKAGLDEARRAVGALRGDDLPGPDLLPGLVSEFQSASSIPARLDVEGQPRPLGSEARLALYRTAQEALTNIRKHSHPSSVAVRLAYAVGSVELLVEDRGSPKPAGDLAATGGGYGLTGMRERAELAGGRLEAGPTAAGFQVRLWLPA